MMTGPTPFSPSWIDTIYCPLWPSLDRRVVALVFELLLLSDLSHSLSCGSFSQFNLNPATPKVKGVKDTRRFEYSRLKNEKDAEDQTDFESVMEIDRENDYNTSFECCICCWSTARGRCAASNSLPAHYLFPPIGSKLLLRTPRNFQFLSGECNLPLTALSSPSALSNSKSMPNQQPVDLSQEGKITRFLVKVGSNRN
ncbi:hypothetical protein WR25_06498 [Diploscapter pachys]|uniref:Uncharacterized protein n=1 Tax=Diploscapter pachys TaxID=2018661 RepID=A0A2A2J2L1_9BILA|nr:hypothetical protein WR25_06498 [Diploscapter pachys]